MTLSPIAEHPPAVPLLRRPVAVRGECLLQQGVEVARPGGAAVHRRQHLDVADRVEPEFGGDAAGGDVHDELGGLLRRVQAGILGGLAGEPVEVAEAGQLRGLAVVDAVGVDDDAGLLGLAEDLGQSHPRDGAGGEQVPQDFAGADRGELVDVADHQQMRPGRDGLDQLVGQDYVHHRGLVHHDQIGVQRIVAVVFGVAAGLQLQQPVHGGGLVAGQLRQPLGGPAGGRDQHHGGLLGRGELDDGTDGEALAAARPAGEHRDLAAERELDRLLLLGGQVLAGPARAASPAPWPSPPGRTRAAVPAWRVQQVQQPDRRGRTRPGGTAPGKPPERYGPWGRRRRHRFADDAFVGRELVQARADQLPVHLEDLGGLADQVGLGQVAVPVVGGLATGCTAAPP